MPHFNPLDKFYKSITGAVPANKKLTLRVKGNFDSVVLMFKKDGSDFFDCLNMANKGAYFEVDLKLKSGLYFYKFSLSDGSFIGAGKDLCSVLSCDAECFQLTVYSYDYRVPEWLSGGVMYQIFPDRFCRFNSDVKVGEDKVFHKDWCDTPIFLPNENGKVINNDFFGGDLKGIISKLPYIKSLGVNVIYLNPIFKAYSNHRYDTGNYMEIDPLLGDEKDFKLLIRKAGKLGIKIILDGVFNHTGDDSLYFNKYGKYPSIGACQSKKSKYFGWFNFKTYPNDYESWWGITTLPSVNEKNKSFVEYITGKDGVLEKYTKLGIGGWRLDVVDELPGFFVKKLRKAVKGINNKAIIIGEVWEDASNKISYGVRREYFQGKELDSVMNYPLKNAILEFVRNGKVNELVKTINQQIDHYPQAVLHSLMNILSTHDTVRLITAVGGENADGKTKSEMSMMSIPPEQMDNAKFKVKSASLLQYTLCGVPCIYYGDEIAMQGYVDPLNRKCYPWGMEDVEMLSWYKKLGEIRNKYSAFVDGEFKKIFSSDGIIIFERLKNDCQVLVVVNVLDGKYSIEFDGKLYDLLSGNTYNGYIDIYGRQLAVLVKKSYNR